MYIMAHFRVLKYKASTLPSDGISLTFCVAATSSFLWVQYMVSSYESQQHHAIMQCHLHPE